MIDMAKVTTEGGASNAADPSIVTCAECGARYAAGAPRCPECPSTATVEAVPSGMGDEDPEGSHAGDEDGALPSPPPVSAPKAEHVDYVATALGVPEDEAAALKKAELVELARSAAAGETGGQAPPEPEAVPVTEAPAPSPVRTPPRRMPAQE